MFESTEPDHEASLEMMRRRLTVEWRPNTADTLYTVAQSSLMNHAQLSGLYSTIGSRCHFRLAAARLTHLEAPVMDGGRVLLDREPRPFFAPVEADQVRRLSR